MHITVFTSRTIIPAAVLASAALGCLALRQGGPVHLDSSRPVSERATGLLSRMSIEEKAAQLRCSIADPEQTDVIGAHGIGGLGLFSRSLDPAAAAEKANRVQKLVVERTRLGIPVIVHDEALHGLVGKGATSFPQAIALAATFDPDLMHRVATAIGEEVRSRGIHQVLSPVVNLALDVRWGRVEETYGEDPYLAARMGAAFCKALETEGVITTPKHLAMNVGAGGRDSHAIDVSERWLRETEFVPFEACFREAGSRSVMAAYNSLNGVPCSANRWLLTDVLRGEWGFRGFVVSDYYSVAGIVRLHRAAADAKEGAAQAIEAGLEMELPDADLFGQPLVDAVREGRVAEATLDRAVRRVLEVKLAAGLFENRSVDPSRASEVNECEAHRRLALDAARKAVVLLQNEGDLLPLSKETGSIAVVGPLADVVRLGGYSGTPAHTVSILEGIRSRAAAATRIVHAAGCSIEEGWPVIPSEFLIPEGGEPGARGLRGEYFANKTLEGPPALVRVDAAIDFDWDVGSPGEGLPVDHFSARWTGKLVAPQTRIYEISATTEDGVRLWIDGKLLIDAWTNRSRTTDRASVRLEAGPHELRMGYYQNRGTASATLGWDWQPGTADAMLREAVEAARACDVCIVVVGIAEGESKDRASLDLPSSEERLILAIAEIGKPIVVVLVSGSAVTISRWMRHVGAIVEAWYPGQEGGTAVAEVLFGDVNPAGRLPITFPLSVGQAPLAYNPRPTGRGWDYVDLSGKPLFPFGFGLSYTRFEYGSLRIKPAEIPPDGSATASVEVTNAGSRRGDEVVQLYVRDEVASVVRPVMELKRFRRVTLDPGETRTVTFDLAAADLAFYDRSLNRVVEPGDFTVMIGASSSDIRTSSNLRIRSQAPDHRFRPRP
jgi:beta-glucosidase